MRVDETKRMASARGMVFAGSKGVADRRVDGRIMCTKGRATRIERTCRPDEREMWAHCGWIVLGMGLVRGGFVDDEVGGMRNLCEYAELDDLAQMVCGSKCAVGGTCGARSNSRTKHKL